MRWLFMKGDAEMLFLSSLELIKKKKKDHMLIDWVSECNHP